MKIIKQLTLLRTYHVPGRAIKYIYFLAGQSCNLDAIIIFIGETEAGSLENLLKLHRMVHERARIKTQAICLQSLPS